MRYVILILFLLCACSTPVAPEPSPEPTPSSPTEPAEPAPKTEDEPAPSDPSTIPVPTLPESPNRAPSVKLTPYLAKPASFTLSFEANAVDPDGDELSYVWNFGDGTVQIGGATASHTYTSGGSFTASVEVSDAVASASAEYSFKLRPVDSPDVMILGFAGRCGVRCGAPFKNEAYLHTEGTLQALADTFAELGYSSLYVSAAANVSLQESETNSYGFYELDQHLKSVKQTWLHGVANPTRLVLVGHSHGATWASLLAYENKDVSFDYGIYFDGVCNSWERDNLYHGAKGNVILNFYRMIGAPYPSTLVGGACQIARYNGRVYHLKDIVPHNIRIGLEVRTNPVVALPDSQTFETLGSCPLGNTVSVADANTNVRPDGSVDNLYYHTQVVQDHCDVINPNGKVMRDTKEFIVQMGLP